MEKKANPVPAVLPEDAKVRRQFPKDPLLSLPKLSPFPTPFVPSERLTQEHLESLSILDNNFLLPEERALAVNILMLNAKAISFTNDEMGTLRDDYFSPVVFPLVKHVPWACKSIPIPPGIRKEVIQQVEENVCLGLWEPSDSSYQPQWFCVAKKDGMVRIVVNPDDMNRHTIRTTGQPPLPDQYCDHAAG